MDAEDPKVVKKIEKSIEKELEKEGMKMIQKFKKLNIDPLGIGEHVRSRTREFNHKEWNDRYQDLDVKVKYHVQITESGISQ
jgi:spore germination protein